MASRGKGVDHTRLALGEPAVDLRRTLERRLVAGPLVIADVHAVGVGDEEKVGVRQIRRGQLAPRAAHRVEAHVVVLGVKKAPEAVLDLERVQDPRDRSVLAVVAKGHGLVDDHGFEGARPREAPRHVGAEQDCGRNERSERDPNGPAQGASL